MCWYAWDEVNHHICHGAQVAGQKPVTFCDFEEAGKGLVDASDKHHDAEQVYLIAAHPHHEAKEPNLFQGSCSPLHHGLRVTQFPPNLHALECGRRTPDQLCQLTPSRLCRWMARSVVLCLLLLEDT